MTINSNGGPGKTRHLNDIAVRCGAMGMRVICVDAAESDFWLSASLSCAPVLEGKARISQGVLVLQRERGHSLFLGKTGSGMSITKQQMSRVFLAKSDVSQIKALYSGEDGERLADAIRQNCNIWFPLEPEEGGHDK
ncbi:hypothetical protein CSM67_003989 [Salmonella enterica subsp. diarizonae]|nr:hypothetical protein [Salmonella enterica subsp. diarizonae]EHG2954936.1 hypothetical protein [Salmonella enterica subsp. diarizonae serovar 53:r:z35]EHG6070350.1 hypothetical protein [Salmonella enterica subsp. diarizonae serovar 61:z52:z53]EJS8541082.1 hypothetical protein [Salmonella enterica]EDV3465544.1 hypothetical protein [Salmonella enterica subsp. diarizonae]